MYISKEQALQILKEHGINNENEPTATMPDKGNAPVLESSFRATFGDKKSYVFEEIVKWLGY